MSEYCRGCSGACCLDIVVHVTPFDVHRLARAHALEPRQIVDWREASASEGDGSSVFGVRIDATERTVRPVLRKSPSDPHACQFLLVFDDRRRCGAYDARPRVCAVYPVTVARGSIDVRADARCGPSDWNMARLDYAQTRRDLAIYTSEWHACAAIAQTWNASVDAMSTPPTFEAYLAFADRVAARVLENEAADLPIAARWNEAFLGEDAENERFAYIERVRTIASSEIVMPAA